MLDWLVGMLLCFRRAGGEEINRRLLEDLNRSGSLHLTHTIVGGEYTIRSCIGQTQTEVDHVRRAWDRIRETASELGAR